MDDQIKPNREEKGEVVGGGFFVAHRKPNGRLVVSPVPFEWPSFDLALKEAFRLAEMNLGKRYVVGSVGDVVQINYPIK